MALFKLSKAFSSTTDTFNKKVVGQICSEAEFIRIIENERARAERNNHYVSLILLDTAAFGVEKGAIGQSMQRITRRIRKVDKIGWYNSRRVGIILPYTAHEGARNLAVHICDSLETTYSASVCSINTYPSDPNVV